MAQNSNPLDGWSRGSDSGLDNHTGRSNGVRANNEVANGQTKNEVRAPLYDRATRLRAVAGADFRVAQPLGLGHRNRKIGAAGEVEIPASLPVAGISTGKLALAKQNQIVARTEWFRYELDFRKTQRGFNVTIRKRLKWSNTRYSKQIVKRFCPQLTRKMIDQISVGKFSKETIAALQNGGITDGFIKELQARIGKGNGKRRTDLTDYERSLLARIESGIRAGN